MWNLSIEGILFTRTNFLYVHLGFLGELFCSFAMILQISGPGSNNNAVENISSKSKSISSKLDNFENFLKIS